MEINLRTMGCRLPATRHKWTHPTCHTITQQHFDKIQTTTADM